MSQCQIGVFGLGVMGSSLAENFLRHGFTVALYSREQSERERFAKRDVSGYEMTGDLSSFVVSLQKPRRIIMMITAGPAVDAVMQSLKPLLEEGDILVDGGNSYYEDTNRRTEEYAAAGLHFVGMGVSGGEEGALHGPSLMVGGSDEAYEALEPYLTAIAAKAGDTVCCGHVGTRGAGHYVKMVHNGIEYGVMELIAEVWQMMHQGLGIAQEDIAEFFDSMSGTRLDSYLAEIAAKVLRYLDEDELPLIEKIRPVAMQKGTGKWTSLESIDRGVYLPTIIESASIRAFSQHREEYKGYGKGKTRPAFQDPSYDSMRNALYLGTLICYAQGLSLIRKASQDLGFDIPMAQTVSLWKGGCIIRSRMLQDIEAAYLNEPETENLLFAAPFRGLKNERADMGRLARVAIEAHIPVPAFASAVTYYDACMAPELPLAMVQALRDCFGAHTYERKDREGAFHTLWEK